MKLGNTTVIRDKYHAIEQALSRAGLSPVRLVQNNEVFGIQVYGDDDYQLDRVVNIMSQFDEEFNMNISRDPNHQRIVII